MLRYTGALVATVMITFACSNEADFGSDSSTTASVATGDSAPAIAQTAGSESCSGDTVKMVWPNPEIGKCIDSGKIWHFANKYNPKEYCSDVSSARSYTCDRDGFISFSEAQSVSTSILVEKLEEGSKLVACGESNEGKTSWAMAQFVTNKGAGSCDVSSSPLTACFVSGSTGCAKGDYDCIVEWCFDQAK